MARLAWRRTAPSTYEADLIDGRTAKVCAQHVDDRDYDGGRRRTYWWAWLGHAPLFGGPYNTKGEAVAAVERLAGPVAPGDWLVLDMDEGLLRVCSTRTEALRWFMDHAGAGRVHGRHSYGPGAYQYTVGGGDPADSATAFIEQASHAVRNGWDSAQRPLYPHADKPFTPEERPGP